MMQSKHPVTHRLEAELKKISKAEIVLDIGTSKRFAKELVPFRSFFKDNYFAFGYEPELGYGGDNCDVSADILALPVQASTVDAVICLEVLEHVANPFKASAELYRILKPAGTLILTTPFLLPFHGKGERFDDFAHGSYPDFWRFTHQGLQLLFQPFRKVEVIPFSNTMEHYANRLFQFEKMPVLRSGLIQAWLRQLQKTYLGCATHRHLVIARK